jgi:hypothetical protein
MKNQRYKNYNDRETLERIKRWPQLIKRFPFVRIYSAQWNAFWRNTGQGYTENPNESAIWTCEDAFKNTIHCGPEKKIQFISVDASMSEENGNNAINCSDCSRAYERSGYAHPSKCWYCSPCRRPTMKHGQRYKRPRLGPLGHTN